MYLSSRRHPAGGFTMVEVMVALIIIAVGLLGIAKLQALSLSSTGVARMRALAAVEASSLASTMHANRSFWAATTAPSFSVTGSTVNAPTSGTAFIAATVPTFSTSPITSPLPCQAGGSPLPPCNGTALASADVQLWASALAATLPGDSAIVTCTTASLPVSCTIQISWTENTVAANSQQIASAALNSPTYTLYVVP